MHALVIITKMDRSLYARQRQELEERIVPLTRHQPGFVSATWTYDHDAGRSVSVILLDSEDGARKFAAFVAQQATDASAKDAGVELESIGVAEVLAQASKGR